VVGLGLIAQVAHLPALRALGTDRVVVSHLCDLSGGLGETIRASGFPDATVTTDWADLVTADVDAVVICTPGSHGRIAEAFLAAGKHVLAEKPMTLSLAETDRLIATAEASGAILQVGYMKAHEPAVQAAAARLADIGELRHVRITVLHPADDPQVSHLRLARGGAPTDAAEIERAHAHEAAETTQALGDVPGSVAALYTDVLNGSVVHQLSLLRSLVGTVPSTWASALVGPLPVADSLDEPPCIQATAQLTADATATLCWNWVPDQPAYREFAELIGTRGTMHLTLSPPYAHERPVLTIHQPGELGEESTTLTADHVDAFRHQMAAFVDAITGVAPVLATAEQVRDDIVSMLSLTALAAAGAGVTVGGEAAR
jgi:predicted dehydrogenase